MSAYLSKVIVRNGAGEVAFEAAFSDAVVHTQQLIFYAYPFLYYGSISRLWGDASVVSDFYFNDIFDWNVKLGHGTKLICVAMLTYFMDHCFENKYAVEKAASLIAMYCALEAFARSLSQAEYSHADAKWQSVFQIMIGISFFFVCVDIKRLVKKVTCVWDVLGIDQ